MDKKISTDKSIEIAALPQKVFDFIIDPNKFALALPELKEITNMAPLPFAEGWHYDFKYFMGGSLLNGTCHYDKLEAPSLFKTYSPTLSDSWWTHKIIPSGSGCVYEVHMEYVIPDGLLSDMQEQQLIESNDQVIDRMVHRLKEILEKK